MTRALLLLALVPACVGDTGGARVDFTAEVAAVAPVTGGAIAYDDAITGWHVELRTANAVVGPVYLWSGKPLGDLQRDADQFAYGFLRGEVVSQVAVDLIAASGQRVPLGPGDGLAGESLSGELWLAPPLGDLAPHTFEIAGRATKGAIAIDFHGALTIDDSIVDESTGATAFERRKVRAIPLGADIVDGGTLTIRADARAWLAGADFGALSPSDPAIPVELAPGDPVFAQWLYQVRQARGPWALAWTAP
ncbi:MAG: hypothetical protein K8W52_28640 [Deltaproteobacteria bacterium]|nr:hypothetical protein [Deltaproteobacteria bacterium]